MRTFITLFLLLAIGLAPTLAITNQAQLQQIEQMQTNLTEKQAALESRYERFSARKKARLERKAAKLKAKIQKRSSSTSGVRLGLVILIVGVVVAILGFAGIADLLITIGVLVFVIGVALWLISLLI